MLLDFALDAIAVLSFVLGLLAFFRVDARVMHQKFSKPSKREKFMLACLAVGLAAFGLSLFRGAIFPGLAVTVSAQPFVARVPGGVRIIYKIRSSEDTALTICHRAKYVPRRYDSSNPDRAALADVRGMGTQDCIGPETIYGGSWQNLYDFAPTPPGGYDAIQNGNGTLYYTVSIGGHPETKRCGVLSAKEVANCPAQ